MNQLGAEHHGHTNHVIQKIDTPSSQPRMPVGRESVALRPGQPTDQVPHEYRPTRTASGSLGGEIPLGIPFLGASMGADAAHATVRCHERGCSPSPSYRRPTRPLPAGQQRLVGKAGHGRAAALRRVHLARVRNDLEAGL